MSAATNPAWFLYLIRLPNGYLYTGISTDVARRLQQHQQGRRGAKSLRGKGELHVVLQQAVGDRSLASKVERAVKALSKAAKEQLLVDPEKLAGLIETCRAKATAIPETE